MANELVLSHSITDAGIVANAVAAKQVFADYQQRKGANTLVARQHDLATFCEFMNDAGIVCDGAAALASEPSAWVGVTWGLVAGFVQWMLGKGLALTSVNRKLSTVKVYAGLAAQAGVITGNDLALIRSVKGYAANEFKRVDEKRTTTRTGAKKATNTKLTPEQARRLKEQPDTPQGRRDAVIMALLIDHGLRVGELAALQTTDVDLVAGTMQFYRPKVSKTQAHKLSRDARRALVAYWTDAYSAGPLLMSSRKGGALDVAGISRFAITLRVGELGERIGLAGLSAHDLRHYWATRAIRKGADPFAVLQAGGWTSMGTVQKYVDETKVANEGIPDGD